MRTLALLAVLATGCDRDKAPEPAPTRVIVDAAVPRAPAIPASVQLPEVTGGSAVPADAVVLAIGSDGFWLDGQRVGSDMMPKLQAAIGDARRYTLVAADRREPGAVLTALLDEPDGPDDHPPPRTVHLAVSAAGQLRAFDVTDHGPSVPSATPLVVVLPGRVTAARSERANREPFDRATLDAWLRATVHDGPDVVVQFDAKATIGEIAPVIATTLARQDGRPARHVGLWWREMDRTPASDPTTESDDGSFASKMTGMTADGPRRGRDGKPLVDLGQQVEDAQRRGSATASERR